MRAGVDHLLTEIAKDAECEAWWRDIEIILAGVGCSRVNENMYSEGEYNETVLTIRGHCKGAERKKWVEEQLSSAVLIAEELVYFIYELLLLVLFGRGKSNFRWTSTATLTPAAPCSFLLFTKNVPSL